jgi:hypothetical protein
MLLCQYAYRQEGDRIEKPAGSTEGNMESRVEKLDALFLPEAHCYFFAESVIFPGHSTDIVI